MLDQIYETHLTGIKMAWKMSSVPWYMIHFFNVWSALSQHMARIRVLQRNVNIAVTFINMASSLLKMYTYHNNYCCLCKVLYSVLAICFKYVSYRFIWNVKHLNATVAHFRNATFTLKKLEVNTQNVNVISFGNVAFGLLNVKFLISSRT